MSQDVYICPAGEKLAYHYTNENMDRSCAATGPTPAQMSAASNAPPAKSAASPDGSTSMFSKPCSTGSTSIRRRCATARDGRAPVRHAQDRMGATHFLMKRLPKVATEMALHVLAYNLTRVMNIIGIQPLLAAMRA